MMKLNGFGNSVIQRLVKTKIKKNLYYEIKDKVFEERFDGIRVSRSTQKVRVYGLDSTREVRARLIELLYERVNYHKDKFIAPIIYNEMKQMEVKKNGKVEHSTTSHDDQVFSYLMAIYVWYDGQNLMERFGIMKNTLKTDDVEEIDYVDIEDQDKEVLDLVDTSIDKEEKPAMNVEPTLEDLVKESKKQKTYNAFEKHQFEEDQKCLRELLQDPRARDAYIKKYNIDPLDKSIGGLANDISEGTIPNTFFIQMNSDDDEISVYNNYAGNLGKEFAGMFSDNNSSDWL